MNVSKHNLELFFAYFFPEKDYKRLKGDKNLLIYKTVNGKKWQKSSLVKVFEKCCPSRRNSEWNSYSDIDLQYF